MIAAIGFGITVMVVLWLLFWIINMFFIDLYFAIRTTIRYLTDKDYRRRWIENHNGERIFIWFQYEEKKMKLISITCPNCGAKLQATPNAKLLTCDYCNCDIMIDDEVKRVKLQDAEQAGYEFEMGRQRALKELKDDAEMMETIGPLY